jgi:hypothetical protein
MKLGNLFGIWFTFVMIVAIAIISGVITLAGCAIKKGVEIKNSEEFKAGGLKAVASTVWEGPSTNVVTTNVITTNVTTTVEFKGSFFK